MLLGLGVPDSRSDVPVACGSQLDHIVRMKRAEIA